MIMRSIGALPKRLTCLAAMVVGVLIASGSAHAHQDGGDRHRERADHDDKLMGPLHGPGSSHNPIIYHPVHGPGSSHNPIVYNPPVVRDHRPKCEGYYRWPPGGSQTGGSPQGGVTVTLTNPGNGHGGHGSGNGA